MPATATQTRGRSIRIIEQVHKRPSRVDRDAGVIRGVKVLGKHSKNGREYSDKALDDAVGLYEGTKVNIDHPPRHQPNKERGFTECVGVLRNAWRKGEAVYADLHYLKTHPDAKLLVEAAERFSTSFGLSHNADGRTVHRGGKLIVESLERVVSVDIVGVPATNRGLFESVDPNDKEPELLDPVTCIKRGFMRAVQALAQAENIRGSDLSSRINKLEKAKQASIAVLESALKGTRIDSTDDADTTTDDAGTDPPVTESVLERWGKSANRGRDRRYGEHDTNSKARADRLTESGSVNSEYADRWQRVVAKARSQS